MKNSGFGEAPFRLGTFASVPMGPGKPPTIQVPYPTLVFNWYNRYLLPYLPQRPEIFAANSELMDQSQYLRWQSGEDL